MATPVRQAAPRLSLRLSSRDKELIEAAASLKGQTIEEFAAEVLVQSAVRTLGLPGPTAVSGRDAELIVSLLEDESARPNAALKAAARRYRRAD